MFKLNQPMVTTPKDMFITESLELINEIKLNVNNAVETIGNLFEGSFTVGEKKYIYKIEKLNSPIIEPNFELNGTIYNIGFIDYQDNSSDPNSYQHKKGDANLIKIYSTMFKIIVDFIKEIQPDYFIMMSLKTTRYFLVYTDLTKNNTIEGYHRKTVSDFPNLSGGTVMGIIMVKNNIQREINKIKEQFEKNLKNLSK